MASGWKSRKGKNKGHDQLASVATAPGSSGRGGEKVDRNEVPQRPPTVGQELPNNLSLLDWQLDSRLPKSKNRKRANLDSSRDHRPEAAHPGNNTDGHSYINQSVMSASLPQMQGTQRQPVTLTESELNTNEIVGKLVQIREYIKQVTSTMAQLEAAGGQAAREKIERLHNVWLELVENEHRLVGLLQRFSVVQHEHTHAASNNSDNESNASRRPNPVANVDGMSDVSDESDDEEEDDDDMIEGLEAANEMSLRKRNELLAKVAESQEKLKSLQDQQALLLSLQQQAESRLTEARTFHDHLVVRSSSNDNQPLTAEETNTSVGLERELQNIEQRLASLQTMYTQRDKIDVPQRPPDGSTRGSSREEIFEAGQQKELQDKLHELQNKKKQMDDLVRELALLRESRLLDSHSSHDGQDDCEGNSDPRAMVVTKEKIAAAKQTLNGVDTNEKSRKLEEMKAWLRTLQDMVSNLSPEQGDLSQGAPGQASGRLRNDPANVDEMPRAVAIENVQGKFKKTKKSKTNNLSREQSNEFVSLKLASPKVASNSSQQLRQNSQPDELMIDVHDPEVMDKVRKLQEAKAKLEMLHGLLNVVQNSQQTGQSLNVEYAEHLLNTIDSAEVGGDLTLNLIQPMSAESAFTAVQPGRLRNDRDGQAPATRKPNAKVISKPLMASQRRPLQQLRSPSEYSRSTESEQGCHKVNVADANANAAAAEAEKLQSSNQELWMEMRHQMALQEELRQRRRELETLMKKDGGGKNYLLNQDNRSENLSASTKSEPMMAVVAASVGATDGTSAATWGGSSLDNGARDTVDGNESQEETNERMIDEDFSSEEGAEVANSTNAMEAMANDASALKTRNQIASSNQSDGPNWRAPEAHRQSLGSNVGDPSIGMATFISSLPNFSKTSWRESERAHSQAAQDNAGVNIQDDRYGHESAGFPFPLNIPLQSGALPVQHQLESTSMLYQAILRDQHILAGMVQQSPNSVPLPTMVVSESLQANHGNLVQQQLLLGLSHCYHLLYLQHIEMQRLQQNIQNSTPCSESHLTNCSRPRANSCEASDAQIAHGATALPHPQWHLDNPSVARLSVSSSSSQQHQPLPTVVKHPQAVHPLQQHQLPVLQHHHHHQHHLQHQQQPPHDMAHGPTNETLNNQVPPGNRANNYWDNFRSYSRQNLLSSTTNTMAPSVPHPNKSNDCPASGHCQSLPRQSTAAGVANLRRRSHGNSSSLLVGSQSPESLALRVEGASGGHGDVQTRSSHSCAKSAREASAAQNAPKDKINKDLGSKGSNSFVLKNRGNTSPINSHNSASTSRGLNSQSMPSGRLSKIPMKDGWNKTNSSVRQRCSESDGCSFAIPSQLSENPVQTEVSRLVSQLNVDPQSLIRLLQELQNLNSEESVRQALIALREASVGGPLYNDVEPGFGVNRISHSLRGDSRGGATGVSRQYQRGHISSSSSDGEDIRTFCTKTKKFSRQNYPSAGLPSDPGPSSAVSGRFGSCSSLESSVMSPLGEGHGEVLSQNMLPRKPPMNYRKMEMSKIQTTLEFPSHTSPSAPDSSATEKAVSPAQARDNENSEMTNSDVPSGRFNVQQLEKQMQAIMLSIASFVASLSHNICNPKCISAIISHIMALVLPLVQSVNQDTVNFLPSQLSCVLDNILQKYVHKRFGEVEDNLLCELSEVLFNELAFLQLMQNLDGGSAQQRSQKFHTLAEKFYLCTRAGNSGSNICHGAMSKEPAADMELQPTMMPGASSHCDGGHSEATDADLAVMARHGDDEDNDKAREDFSCDIPDVCALRMAPEDPSLFRTSPSHNIPHNQNSHPSSPLPLPDLGALAAAAEGQGEMHYFDREVEIEGEGLGDTQDLAEADQSQGYMEAESALDDVQGESFQAWGIDHNAVNGGIDRTEDDQHDEDEPLGAAGGLPIFASRDQMDGERLGPEIGLDEVPIKLREGSASGTSQARAKDDSQTKQCDSHDSCKGKRSSDHASK